MAGMRRDQGAGRRRWPKVIGAALAGSTIIVRRPRPCISPRGERDVDTLLVNGRRCRMSNADPRVDALKEILLKLHKSVDQLVLAIGQDAAQRDRLLDNVRDELLEGELALNGILRTPPRSAQRR